MLLDCGGQCQQRQARVQTRVATQPTAYRGAVLAHASVLHAPELFEGKVQVEEADDALQHLNAQVIGFKHGVQAYGLKAAAPQWSLLDATWRSLSVCSCLRVWALLT